MTEENVSPEDSLVDASGLAKELSAGVDPPITVEDIAHFVSIGMPMDEGKKFDVQRCSRWYIGKLKDRQKELGIADPADELVDSDFRCRRPLKGAYRHGR